MPSHKATPINYRALAPDSAGCFKCDEGMPMVSEHQHKDGSVCEVVRRNYGFSGVEHIAPMGNYDPRADMERRAREAR